MRGDMAEFQIGQRVLCIDDDFTKCVKRGETYTIYAMYGPFLIVGKLRGPMPVGGMFASRFQLPRETDISIFTAMTNKTKVLEPA